MTVPVTRDLELKYMLELAFLAIQKRSRGRWTSKSASLRYLPAMQYWTLDEILARLQDQGMIELKRQGDKRFSVRSTIMTTERKKS
jgi:hypothetical protein